MGRIAVIGWGSLLWDLDDLTPKVSGDWKVAGGPRLPFEFVRVSDKRKKALVVVIDYEHGVECATSFIESARTQLHDAVDDLAARERTTKEYIGHCDLNGNGAAHIAPNASNTVQHWLNGNGFDGAVWTDLPGNFQERLSQPFSLEAAMRYLQGLQGDARTEAKCYITNAPANIDTPLRTALVTQAWWRDIPF